MNYFNRIYNFIINLSKQILILTFITLVDQLALMNAFALVEYAPSDSANSLDSSDSATPISKLKSASNPGPSIMESEGKSNNDGFQKFKKMSRHNQLDVPNFNLGFEYDSLSSKVTDTQISLLNIYGSFRTDLGLFSEISYYRTSSSETFDKNNFREGNGLVIIGVNWLQVGGVTNSANLDLYVGASMAAKNSEYATSRNDQLFAVRSIKNFGLISLGLAYELWVAGRPDNPEEMSIGNFNILKFALQARLSTDIIFSLEASRMIIRSSNENTFYKLSNDQTFNSITPSLNLILGPILNFKMGAHFKTYKNANEDQLFRERLYMHRGVYGTALFIGMNISV